MGKQRALLAAAIATALTVEPSAWAAEALGPSARSTPEQDAAPKAALRPARAPAASNSNPPVAALKPEPSWPRTLIEANAAGAAVPTLQLWSQEEIRRAKSLCAQVLASAGAVAVPIEPIRDGSCGAPAPVHLMAIGTSPQVVISPPATLTCEMVAALSAWLKNDLQPLARRHLGSPITQLQTLSSYSCRTASGRARDRLSEHGRANALDVSGFVTASMQTTALLADWGMTERELREQVAAKAAAEKLAAAEQAMTKGRTPAAVGQGLASARQGQAAAAMNAASPIPSRGTIIEGAPDPSGGFLSGTFGPWSTSLSFAAPSHLGGPTPQQASMEPPLDQQLDRKAQFLRAAHDSACKIFGTVLGPEANEAHRNHLHLDMAQRSFGTICR